MTTIFDLPGSHPPNLFTTPIHEVVTSFNDSTGVSSSEKTAAEFVDKIRNSSEPARTLWELWDAFFTSVVHSSTHVPHLALLDALRTQPPVLPANVRPGSDAERQLHSYTLGDQQLHWDQLPRFSAQWRDVHDILENWRGWDGVRSSTPNTNSIPITSGKTYYLRFCAFSATLLGTQGTGCGVHPIWVFYACQNTLERNGPDPSQTKAHWLSPDQMWVLDIHIVALWVRDAGRMLWNAKSQELREHWETALDDKTQLWSEGRGLTRERWQLWKERLHTLQAISGLDNETKNVVKEAQNLITALLDE